MVKEPNVNRVAKEEADDLLVVAVVIGDTTWRMFVPSVGMTLLGVWLDSQWQTKPWLMIGGIVLGFAVAIALVRVQLRRAQTPKGGEK